MIFVSLVHPLTVMVNSWISRCRHRVLLGWLLLPLSAWRPVCGETTTLLARRSFDEPAGCLVYDSIHESDTGICRRPSGVSVNALRLDDYAAKLSLRLTLHTGERASICVDPLGSTTGEGDTSEVAGRMKG